jgi:hypothetical protein
MQAARDAAEAQHRELKQQVAMRQLAEQRRELFEMMLRVTELKQANERMLAAVAAPAEGPLHERPVPVNVMNDGIAPADSASQMGAPSQLGASHIGTKRRRYKDPTPYEGKTLKEATMFQTSLETIFAIDPITFETGREKVLYASTSRASRWRSGASYTAPTHRLPTPSVTSRSSSWTALQTQ